MHTVLVLGSSRRDLVTYILTKEILQISNWEIIDLNDYKICGNDYTNPNCYDDFLDLIEEIIEDYTTIVFVTPIYLYSMSGILKVFLDRFYNLVTTRKDLDRKLCQMRMGVITTSNGINMGDQFWLPFKTAANYLGMEFVTGLHTNQNADNRQQLNLFITTLDSRT